MTSKRDLERQIERLELATRLEREAVDENPSACGLTEAERDFLDVLTGGPP